MTVYVVIDGGGVIYAVYNSREKADACVDRADSGLYIEAYELL